MGLKSTYAYDKNGRPLFIVGNTKNVFDDNGKPLESILSQISGEAAKKRFYYSSTGFPDVGDSDCCYCDGYDFYIWDSDKAKYETIISQTASSALEKAHSHSNKIILDSITKAFTEEDLAKLNLAAATASTAIQSIKIGTQEYAKSGSEVTLPTYPTRSSLEIDLVDNTSDLDKPVSNATADEFKAIRSELSSETLRATTTESSLSNSISQESLRAIEAEKQTDEALQAEVTRATLAEQNIASELNSEVARAQEAETTNANNISAETTRAQGAEKTLTDNLSAEQTRSKAAEKALTDNLSTEVTRAKAKESELQGNIDAHTSTVAGELQALKAADTDLDEKKANTADVNQELGKRYTKDQVFTKQEILQKIEDLIGTAPDTLDTFKEIADALGNDPNFAATIMNELSGKVDKAAGKQLTSNDYSDGEKAIVADVNAKKHTHSNKSVIDKITQGLLDNWTAAYNHISDSVKHITATERTNWNDADSKKHTHSNKSIIDKITQALIDNWGAAYSHITDVVKHITATERTNWNDANTKKHSHSNKGVVDKITQAMLDKLSGISPGAEVNVQADWTATDTGSDQYIKNKPETFPPSQHEHTELGPTVSSLNSSSDNAGKFYKLATMKITSRYGFVSRTYECIVGSHGATTTDFLRLNVWFKQQDEFGNDPYMSLSAIDNDSTVEKIKFYAVVDELNPTNTLISLYVEIMTQHTTCKLFTVAKSDGGSTIKYYNDSDFIDSLPSTGTIAQQVDCSGKHKHTKSQITDMPTKLSQFSNDAGFLTSTDVDTSQNHTHANKTVLDKVNQAMLDKLAGIAEGANKYVHPSTSGNKHIPAGGTSGQILRWGSDGTAIWGTDNNTTYNDVRGATASAAGTHGLVPAPAAGEQGRFLKGDGTWAVPNDTIYTHPNSGVSAGTYQKITVNAQGHVTGGSNPTTLAGYGITDAVSKNGGTLTNMKDFIYSIPENTAIWANDTNISQTPFEKYLWHDIFAFCKTATPSYFTSTDNSVWNTATLNKKHFSQNENNNISVLTETITGARWVWNNSSFSYSSAKWLQIGVAHKAKIAKYTIVFESSADGTTWTVRHQSTYQNHSKPVWCYLNPYGSDSQLRLTITKDPSDSGELGLNVIRLLSSRYGDQGKGSEYEYPYIWDADMNVQFPEKVTAKQFVGNITGKLSTPRSINGTNFDGSSNITTSKWGTARNLKIGNATKPVDGSADISFTASEIGLKAEIVLKNISIPVSSFENLVAKYANSGIMADQIPDVVFDKPSQTVAAKAGITVSTETGNLVLTALRLPESDLTIESLILKDAS